MADHAKTPDEMNFKGNVANNWKLWEQKFNLYLLASGKSNKADDVKVAILLNSLGDEGIQIYNTFEYANLGDDKKQKIVLEKFRNYCNPVKNLVYEHFKFFKRDKKQDELVDQFVTALRQLAASCEFKEQDVLIRDRLVLGIRIPRIQEKLLQNGNLKLSEAIQICRSMESSVATQKCPTQQRYNHIEKELLAVVIGCERFHYYLFGRRFIIHTDHRPLLGLLKKPIDDLSHRIRRLALRLLRYNFQLVYVPGKQMQVADALSRDPSTENINTDYLDSNLMIYSVIVTSNENEDRLQRAIVEDDVLQKVKQFVLHGWPAHKVSVTAQSALHFRLSTGRVFFQILIRHFEMTLAE